MNKETQQQIIELAQHQIPFYAYGNNEAACDMAKRLSEIAEIVSRVDAVVKPEIADIDKGHGICVEHNCKKFATADYNGHGHWVCDYHNEKLNRDFDEDYQ